MVKKTKNVEKTSLKMKMLNSFVVYLFEPREVSKNKHLWKLKKPEKQIWKEARLPIF
jgi:hypothetical protein